MHGQRGKNAEVVGATVSEDVVLQELVPALCVLVELKYFLADALIVGVLSLETFQEALHVATYRVGKQEAGIAVALLSLRQEKRLDVILCFRNLVFVRFFNDCHRFLVHRSAGNKQGILFACQRVDGLQQDAIAGGKDAVGINDRRHPLERANEVVCAFQFLLDASDNLIVLPHLAVAVVEVAPQVGSLLTGIRHVKGIVGGLRIKHQSDLLALVHVPDQLLVLLHALLFVALHESLLHLVVCL